MKNEKLDKTLKENLGNRRISPSDSGWEKLSERLDKEEEKHRKPSKWIGIAAVFLGGILIGGLVFQKGHTPVETPVVTIPSQQNNEEETEKPEKVLELKKGISKEENALVSREKIEEKPNLKSPVNQVSNESKPSAPQKPEILETRSSFALTEDTVQLRQQADKIIQAVMEKNQIAKITDAEIEKLLNQARTEIQKEPQFVWDENHVDAQALLENVEQELNPSYKEKLFQFVEDKLIQLASSTRISR